MADVTTSYKVQLYFEVEKQKAVLDFLGNVKTGAAQADRHVAGLSDTLKGVAKLAVGAFGLHEAKRAFIDFNSNMEQAKLTMAGLVSSMKGGTLQDSLKDANHLVDQLQMRSKSTVLTTEELVHMAQSITEPVMQAGGGMKDLEDFTVGAGVAAKALGANADYASIEITEALQGNWTKRARFMNMLMGPTGLQHDQFNKMSSSQRFAAVSGALNAPWLKQLADAQRNSFEGVTSTLKDNLQIALGKVGLPLFKAITKEIQSWNTWLDKHPKEIEAFANEVSSLLVGGFGVVKDVLHFIWENRELLKLLAEAALVSKGLGIVGGISRGAFGAIGSFAERLGGLANATKKVADEEESVANQISNAGGKFTMGLQALTGGFSVGMGLVALYENAKEKQTETKLDMSTAIGFSSVFASQYGGLFGGAQYQKGATPFLPSSRMQIATDLYGESGKDGILGQYKKYGILDQYGSSPDLTAVHRAVAGDDVDEMVDTGGMGQMRGQFKDLYAMRKALGPLADVKKRAYDDSSMQNVSAYKFAEAFDQQFAKEMQFIDKVNIVLKADADRRLQDWSAMMDMMGVQIKDAMNPADWIGAGVKILETGKKVIDAEVKAKKAAHEHGKDTPTPKKGDIHVHVNRMEVVADDADRVVIGLMTLSEDALRNPGTAAGVYRDR